MKKDEKLVFGKMKEKYGAYSCIDFFPVKDQVIILPLYVAPISKPSLILPDSMPDQAKKETFTYDKYPYQGLVMAVGPGFDSTHPTVVRPGMRVFMNAPFTQEPGRIFLLKKVNYYKCQEGNICGIVEGDIDDPTNDINKIEEGKIIPMTSPVKE